MPPAFCSAALQGGLGFLVTFSRKGLLLLTATFASAEAPRLVPRERGKRRGRRGGLQARCGAQNFPFFSPLYKSAGGGGVSRPGQAALKQTWGLAVAGVGGPVNDCSREAGGCRTQVMRLLPRWAISSAAAGAPAPAALIEVQTFGGRFT